MILFPLLAHVAKYPFLDFPGAWQIQRLFPDLPHHPKCSSVPGWHPMSGPGFLCDCSAVEVKWRELRELLPRQSNTLAGAH